MAKRAPIEVIRAGTVHPGKYLVLVGGAVADVEEALEAGREVGGLSVRDEVFLPNIHPDVVAAVRGRAGRAQGEALGVIETATVAATIKAADAGLKGARVRLLELRLADDLGGKGYLLFDGPVSEVEAAVEMGGAAVGEARGLSSRVIAQLHDEMAAEPRRRCPLRGASAGVADAARARDWHRRGQHQGPRARGRQAAPGPAARSTAAAGASQLVAADAVHMAGPGELVYFVASREAAQALPETFVPVDHAIVGIVDAVTTLPGAEDAS